VERIWRDLEGKVVEAMDTEKLLNKLRELIRAEVNAGIAAEKAEALGCQGGQKRAEKYADAVFAELVEMLKEGK
jgi:hypothetical protein